MCGLLLLLQIEEYEAPITVYDEIESRVPVTVYGAAARALRLPLARRSPAPAPAQPEPEPEPELILGAVPACRDRARDNVR